jgi:hypothetical protein
MKAPLGRTARIWALTLLLGGVALLVAIVWIGFGHDRSQSKNEQTQEISEGLVETTTPPVVLAKPPTPPKMARPAPQDERKVDLQLQAKPAQAEPQPAAPPTAELAPAPATTLPLRTGIFGGLNRVVGWATAAMRDAGAAGPK